MMQSILLLMLHRLRLKDHLRFKEDWFSGLETAATGKPCLPSTGIWNPGKCWLEPRCARLANWTCINALALEIVRKDRIAMKSATSKEANDRIDELVAIGMHDWHERW